jgi:hypothetical protein
MSGHIQRLSLQLNGTSGYARRHHATLRECLLAVGPAFESRSGRRSEGVSSQESVAGSQTGSQGVRLQPCPRRKSGAVGSARTASTWTPRGTDTWVRSRSATALLEPVLDAIGARLLRDLGARDVRSALSQLATRYSTRSLQITRNSLERAIRHAESNDLVGRNVAALVKTPQGRDGRPSKSFALEQAKACRYCRTRPLVRSTATARRPR